MKCDSVYYGRLCDWHCKKEAGHAGAHAADLDWRGRAAKVAAGEAKLCDNDDGSNYVVWDDEDSVYTFSHKFCKLIGGK